MKKTTLSAAIALAFVISAPVWANDDGSSQMNDNDNRRSAQAQNESSAFVDNSVNSLFIPILAISDSGNTTVSATTNLTGSVNDNDAFQGNIGQGGGAGAGAHAGALTVAGAEAGGGGGGAGGGMGGGMGGGGGNGDDDGNGGGGGIGGGHGGGEGGGMGAAGAGALAAAAAGAWAEAGGGAGTYNVSNCISNSFQNLAGIANVSQNNGANSLIQQGVTVQANLSIH